MEIIGVIAMSDRRMPATRTVHVRVIVPMVHGSSSLRRMGRGAVPGQALPEAP